MTDVFGGYARTYDRDVYYNIQAHRHLSSHTCVYARASHTCVCVSEATAALFFDLDRREDPEGVVVRYTL